MAFNTGNSGGPGEPDDLVNAVARVSKNLEKIRQNQGMVVTEASLSCLPSGQMRTGDSEGRLCQTILIKAQQKKEKERHFKALIHQIEELNARLAELDAKIAQLDKEIAELDEELSEQERKFKEEFGPNWRQEIKKPENKNHADVILYNQNTQTRNDKARQRDELEQERAKVSEELGYLYEQHKMAKKAGNVEAENFLNQKMADISWEQRNRRLEQIELESHDEVENRSEYYRKNATNSEVLNVDQEIEAFMKEFARIGKIENPNERMMQEKQLVNRLSEDAKDNLQFENSTAHLFEENYFKPLETETKLAANTEQDISPSPNV